ncbi:MAG: hypothetical protein IPO78_17355 [Saprospiraceae bacterium]|nr:hypothetical protein [Saprospiraceae bacterium]
MNKFITLISSVIILALIMIAVVLCCLVKQLDEKIEKRITEKTIHIESEKNKYIDALESTKRQLSIFKKMKSNSFSDSFTLDYSQEYQFLYGKSGNVYYQLRRKGNFFVVQTYIAYDNGN